MPLLAVLFILSVMTTPTTATTCDACKTAYTSEKVAAGADDPSKCTALKNYLTCLGTSLSTDAGCPPVTADALSIQSDFQAASCASSFTDTCVCQKNLWSTDQTPNDAAVCSAGKALIACLKGKTAPGCDGITSVVTLGSNADNRMSALSGCSLTGTVCSCDLEYVKSSLASGSKCTTYKNYLSCLVEKTGTGCDGSTALHTLATSTSSLLDALPSCNKTGTCSCEISYTKKQITASNKCSELKNFVTCLQDSVENGCDVTITRTTVGNKAKTALNSLGATCPITGACQCEIDYSVADVTEVKKCSATETLVSCLTNRDSSELVCDGTTSRSIRVPAIESGIKAKVCSGAEVPGISCILLLLPLIKYMM